MKKTTKPKSREGGMGKRRASTEDKRQVVAVLSVQEGQQTFTPKHLQGITFTVE